MSDAAADVCALCPAPARFELRTLAEPPRVTRVCRACLERAAREFRRQALGG